MSVLPWLLLLCVALLAGASCAEPILVIGRPGLGDGEFREPRALDVSEHGLAVVDKSGRVQVFDLDGKHVRTTWLSDGPVRKGLPCGISWLDDGWLAVADTHQSQVTLIDPQGKPVRAIGEYGAAPGQILFPQRIDVLPNGNIAVTQYGFEKGSCVQEFQRDGTFVRRFGGNDPELGGLTRPMGVLRRDDGTYLVSDQTLGIVRFHADGRFDAALEPVEERWGRYLYGLRRGPDGTLFTADVGEHRLAWLDGEGQPLFFFGELGMKPGQFREPWDVAWYGGQLYVADRYNHRVQRLDVDNLEWQAR